MPNSLALFALFALFTTGSAEITCQEADPITKYCTNSAGNIGTCPGNGTVCAVDTLCSTIVASQPCGDFSGKTLTGKCTSGASNRKCEYIADVVNVKYIVEAKTNQLNPVATRIDTQAFEDALKGGIGRDAKDTGRVCTAKTYNVNDGDVECPANNSSPCKLTCDTDFSKKEAPKFQCDPDSQTWTGSDAQKGKCAKMCKYVADDTNDNVGSANVEATPTNDTDGVIESLMFAEKVEHGELKCTDPFFESGTACTLSCDDQYRVAVVSTLKCKGTSLTTPNDWAFETDKLGACESSRDIPITMNLTLNEGETVADLLANTIFRETFRTTVAAHVAGVESHHVRIDTIALASGRRLNERSVQVDYAVQVAKDDPSELDRDDGRLLRGIQEGLQGIL